MTTFTSKTFKSILTLTTASFALFAGEAMLAPQAAFADDCLLDRNNNGDVDLSDDDGGANSFNVNSRLACGVDATATGDFSTALGYNSEATMNNTTAVGAAAHATGLRSTAIGTASDATMEDSTAVGDNSQATGIRSTAVGERAEATMTDATAVGQDAQATGLRSCLLYTSPSPRDATLSRMPSSA